MSPEGFCCLFLVYLCFLEVLGNSAWGWSVWGSGMRLFILSRCWGFVPGLNLDDPTWLLVPSAALCLAWCSEFWCQFLLMANLWPISLCLTVHPFFMLQICYSVLLSVIEAFDSPGSAGTDIKSAGGCRETEENSWGVVRLQGISPSRQEWHPENAG